MRNNRHKAVPPTAVELTPEQRARKAARQKRRRRRRMMRTAIVLTVLLLLSLVITLAVLHISGKIAQKDGKPAGFLSVKEILVEGDTRYAPEDIIEASGLYVGESLLVINKVQAHNAILEKFPYLDFAGVGNSSFSTVVISVRETKVMGIVEGSADWLVLGENNHALERVSSEELPEDMVQIVGADLTGETVGEPLLDERSMRVASTILTAAETVGLEGLTRIDMAEKTNVRVQWKGQIDVLLGNESNLAGQIQALQKMLPTLIGNNGEGATGTLDMTSFADDDSTNDRGFFTPAE